MITRSCACTEACPATSARWVLIAVRALANTKQRTVEQSSSFVRCLSSMLAIQMQYSLLDSVTLRIVKFGIVFMGCSDAVLTAWMVMGYTFADLKDSLAWSLKASKAMVVCCGACLGLASLSLELLASLWSDPIDGLQRMCITCELQNDHE